MIIVLVPLQQHRARGVCSRWLPQVHPGVFVGVLHRAGRDHFLTAVGKYPGIRAYWEQGGQLVAWVQEVQDRQSNV